MQSMMEILLRRRSLRHFAERDVEENLRQKILEAAFQAPTAGNQQMYSILDIRDPSIKQALSESCDNQPFIAKAPMVLIFLADYEKWHRAYGLAGLEVRPPGQGELLLAIQDAVIAAQNAVIAAESLGLGSCYIGDILENKEFHQDLLKLPKRVLPISMLVLGYPQSDRVRPARPRFDQEHVVFKDRYRELSDEEILDMMATKAGDRDVMKFIQRMGNFKYTSDFAEEMKRSAQKYLEEWMDDN